MGLHTYIDANVIINSFLDDQSLKARAKSAMFDSERDYLFSDYLWLETMPKMLYNKRFDQAATTLAFFEKASFVPASQQIIDKARELASKFGLAAMDALHASAAIVGGAREFLTFEKPEKPFFRIPADELLVISLYEKMQE
jgi:predicted nucleic acid-binding protein